MGVNVSMWGAVGSTPLDLAEVPTVGSSIVSGALAYPVLAIALGEKEAVYAEVGPGVAFGGLAPAPAAEALD